MTATTPVAALMVTAAHKRQEADTLAIRAGMLHEAMHRAIAAYMDACTARREADEAALDAWEAATEIRRAERRMERRAA